jgi:LPS export ABC transporter protein LptC
MNNIYRFIIFLPLFILGCAQNVIDDNKIIQKISSLDMNIFSKKGDRIYNITSPNSLYDKVKLELNLEKTTISIFDGKVIKHIIKSDSSKLRDNNEVVELTGNVELRTLNKESDLLYGDYLFWNIKDTKYELIGNVRFENKNIKLNSNRALLDSSNIIEFFNPVKYIIKDENNENKYEINSENAYYDLTTESVSFKAKDKRVKSIIYF